MDDYVEKESHDDYGEADRGDVGYWFLFAQQVKTLLWKAWKYMTNNLLVTIIRFTFGILCIVFFGMILLFGEWCRVLHGSMIVVALADVC